MEKILIIDDDDSVRSALRENLTDVGFHAIEASDGREGIRIFLKENPSSVLLDLKMPGMDGMTVLKELKSLVPEIPVIVVTAYGDIPTAVEATKLGAYDFILKPPDYERLVLTVKRASENYELSRKVQKLNRDVETSFEYLLGKSDAIQKVIQQIHHIADSDFSLIIQGETGTGKSFIARVIHNLSKRSDGPLVTVDIGAVPETLVESELFGHERGAFTGAEKARKGFFEVAHKGTMIIDELQNLSPYVQSKLLLAVEEKKIHPLGSTRTVETDVRIIGATNTDIIAAVKSRSFREDLFYRLSEFIITIPPLRERPDDIPFFSEKFFIEAAEDLNKKITGISDDALHLLKKYSWPGNIRELKNVIRRAVLLCDERTIQAHHIQFLLKGTETSGEKSGAAMLHELQVLDLEELEKEAIRKALKITNGNKSRASSILNINYTTLLRKLKQYGI